MTVVGEIDFLEDDVVRGRLVRWSLALLAIGALVGAALALSLAALGAGRVGDDPAWLLAFDGGARQLVWFALLVVAFVASLPVHELVHAALFRLFGGPGTRVRFGCQSGMLYAACPGLVLTRGRFCVVLAGPALVVSALLVAGGYAAGVPSLGLVAFTAHLSGCAGDLLAIWLAIRTPRCTHCEDTERGVRFLG